MIEFVSVLALYLVPLYITNSMALIFGGNRRLDFGKKLWGQPLFGKGKSIEGTFAGIFIGLVAVTALGMFLPQYTAFVHADYFMFGSLLCIGTIAGDIGASFIKRRLGVKRGEPVLLLDQLDFVIGGMAFTFWMRIPGLDEAAAIVAVTLVVHRLSNYIAFKAKMKNVPW